MKARVRSSGFSALLRVTTPRFALLSARTLAYSLVLISAALAFVPWQQTSMGSGKVIAYSPVEREQTIKAPMKGLIARWHVQEGAIVKKGQLIVELADNDPLLMTRLTQQRDAKKSIVAAATISIEAVRNQVVALKKTRVLALAAADARIRMAKNKVLAARQKLFASKATLKTAKLNEVRQKKLQKGGLTSDRAVELAELSRAKAEASFYSAKAALQAAKGDLLAKRAERLGKAADVDGKIAKARATIQKGRAEQAKGKASLVSAEVKLSRQARMKVTAPRDGVIARVLAKQGSEYVKAGEPLALLVPDTMRRAVAVWVDGNDVPLIHPGRTVRLQFEGWPAVQFSGWPSVAVGTFGGRVKFVDATADPDGRFRVVVVPGPFKWPDQRYLRQSVRANAWILLDQVSLGYEIWRQLNGFPASSSQGGSSGVKDKGGAKAGKGQKK
jgi:adhesin transport system membrane fusion protein